MNLLNLNGIVMLQQTFLLITSICTIHLQPINGFIFSSEDAINSFTSRAIEILKANRLQQPGEGEGGGGGDVVNSSKVINHNQQCDEHFQMFVDGLENREEWAVLMFDAWGKLPSGMAFGNTLSLGNYDLCMNIHHLYGPKLEALTAQSCIVPMIENARAHLFEDIDIFSSMKQLLMFHERYSQKRVGGHNYDIPPFLTAVCVPAVCGPHYVSRLVNDFVKTYNYSVPSFEGAGFCQTNERPAMSASDWSAAIFFGAVGLLLIFSTVYNQIMVGLKGKSHDFFGCFSLYSNAQQLFSFKVHNSSDVLQCLNGIRFLSIVWIVYLHTNFIYMSQPAINSIHRVEWAQTVFAMFYHSGNIAVDTFLVIGGLLMTWQFLKKRDQNKDLSLFKLYLHRYIRLTTVTAPAIWFTVTLLKYTGNGPTWETSVATSIENCQNYWWSALLHIQNYVNPNEMCLGHTWYLSVDMQLYILAPFLLYPIWRWGRKWAAIIVALIVASILCNFFLVYYREFKVSYFENDKQSSLLYQRLVYLPTHTRMGPYLVGMLLGLVMHTFKGQKVVINKTVVILLWLVTLTTLLAVIFGPHSIHRPLNNETVLQSALYEALSRVAWSIAIAWLIFACTHGYGGAIHWLLAHQMWQPFAKLTFCIYVLHLPIQIMLSASEKQSIYLSDIRIAHKFWGDFGFALLLATVWSLAFEIPMPLLENYGRTIVDRVRSNKGISTASLANNSATDVTANANGSNINDGFDGVVVEGKVEKNI